jgi:hypothetical protein
MDKEMTLARKGGGGGGWGFPCRTSMSLLSDHS